MKEVDAATADYDYDASESGGEEVAEGTQRPASRRRAGDTRNGTILW